MCPYTLQATRPSSRCTYWSALGHSRQTTLAASVRSMSPCSFWLTGNTSGQSASSSTACMKPSVISSDRLNWRRRPSSRLARMKSFTSGCDTSKVPICAPRRPPALDTVKHILSKISMKDIGPEV